MLADFQRGRSNGLEFWRKAELFFVISEEDAQCPPFDEAARTLMGRELFDPSPDWVAPPVGHARRVFTGPELPAFLRVFLGRRRTARRMLQ